MDASPETTNDVSETEETPPSDTNANANRNGNADADAGAGAGTGADINAAPFAADPTHDKRLYPEKDGFMKAIQDPGTPKKNDKAGVLEHKKLKSFLSKYYKTTVKPLKSAVPQLERLPQTDAHVVKTLLNCVLKHRKQCDTLTLHTEFHKYAKKNDTQMYIIENDVNYFGFNKVLWLFLQGLAHVFSKKDTARNGSDGVRVMAIMLLPKYKIALSNFIKRSKTDRSESDQAVDPDVAWALECLTLYNDPDFVVQRPDGVRDEDLENIDPNDRLWIMELKDSHTAKWFLETWKLYVKPKYNDANKMWWKKTGTGFEGAQSGEDDYHHKFGDYCGAFKWISWIYQLDRGRDHILACSAKAKPPAGIGNESGFGGDIDSSDSTNPTSNSSSSSNKKKNELRAAEEMLKTTIETRSKFMNLVGKLEDVVDKRTAAAPAAPNFVDRMFDLEEQKNKVKNTTFMTPGTKRAATLQIEKEQLDLSKKLKAANPQYEISNEEKEEEN